MGGGAEAEDDAGGDGGVAEEARRDEAGMERAKVPRILAAREKAEGWVGGRRGMGIVIGSRQQQHHLSLAAACRLPPAAALHVITN